jgi:gamma-glutamylputrescine oxidase
LGNYLDSHYARTAAEPGQYPSLAGAVEVETCVIGGGLAGLATALDLAERGRSVVLLEQHRVGWGASGRNGGFASPGFPSGAPALVEAVGMADAQALYAEAVAAHELLRSRIARYGIDCGPVVDGQLRCGMANSNESLESYCDWMARHFGLAMQHRTPADVRAVLDTTQYGDAFFNPYTFSLHPLNLSRGLARAIATQGGRVHEGTPVLRLSRSGASHVVHTPSGPVTAANVVLACGG